MSNVHIRTIEDDHGDLVDLQYFHHGCAPDDVPGWPAPEAVDYPVHCEACGDRIESVPLTAYGEREAATCSATDADECSMARERSVAGISDTIPDCAVHGTYRGKEVTA